MSAVRSFALLGGIVGVVMIGAGVIVWKKQLVAPESGPLSPVLSAKGSVSSLSHRSLPTEHKCLAPPDDAGDEGMVASAGLDAEVVRSVMRGAVQSTLSCFRGAPSITMMLEINVACTGRVARVNIEEDGGASSQIQSCVQDSLRYAAFPAHALPEGDTFEYPIAYNAPT